MLIVAASNSGNPRVPEKNTPISSSAFSTFAPLPSNLSAYEAGMHFSSGRTSLVAIVGPCGWGKTHLLQAMAERCQTETGSSVQILDVSRALAAPGRLESRRALLLDDVQEVFGKPKLRQLLRVMLERRIKSGRPTMLSFTGDAPTRQIKLLLPNSRVWTYGSISEPQEQERVLIIQQMAADEGLFVAPQLISIVAKHMRVNGHTLCGSLKRLRLSGEEWLEHRGTLRALGVLNPFFSDNPEWDLQHSIHNAASSLNLGFEHALYTMMCIANLPEVNVARWAQMEPAEAFAATQQFRKRLSSDEDSAASLRNLVEGVVASLAQ